MATRAVTVGAPSSDGPFGTPPGALQGLQGYVRASCASSSPFNWATSFCKAWPYISKPLRLYIFLCPEPVGHLFRMDHMEFFIDVPLK